MKPANVMITGSGVPILIDFGAARAYGTSQTMTSMLSRRYAAIEQFPVARQAAGLLREGPWTDLYALSVMLYELMTQSLPPSAEARFAERRARRSDPYLPVGVMLRTNRITASFDRALLDLVDGGCALMPEDRPASTLEFRRRIAHLLAGPPAGPSRAPRLPSPPGGPARADMAADPLRPEGHWGKILVMLALILGLALAVALVAARG